MAFAFDDISCGGQLQVGAGVVPAIGVGDNKINGSAHIEGPMVVGPPQLYPAPGFGTLMVGPLANDDPDCVGALHSLVVTGPGDAVHINGNMYVTGTVDCLSTGRLEARHSTADGKPKLFDIPHPTKGEGHRLAHACIEGAEVAIYHRGRVRNEKEIILPDYWKDLVHMNSISVQLQPIGAHQDIIVKRWDQEKIYLQSKSGIPIDCFYHVYAERKDVNALVVEYEGETYEDSPDREGNDPKYDDNVNTRTL